MESIYHSHMLNYIRFFVSPFHRLFFLHHFLLPCASIYSLSIFYFLMLLSTTFPFPTPSCFYLLPHASIYSLSISYTLMLLPTPSTSPISYFLMLPNPSTSPISYSLMLIHTSSPSPVSFSFMRISTPLSLPRFLRTYANTYPQLSISRFLFPHTSTYPLFLSRFLLPRPECFNLPPFHASSTPLCCYLPPLDLNLHCLL